MAAPYAGQDTPEQERREQDAIQSIAAAVQAAREQKAGDRK